MGGVASLELAVAVSRAGALGTIGGVMIPAELLGAMLAEASQQAGGPIGVNFLMPFVDRDAVEVAASRCRLVEFFYGDPERELVELAHAGGALAAWQVGSAEEGRAAEAAGCDVVIAQGVEAGGHVRGKVGLLPLLDAVLDTVDVPVVAAGGIGTARGMAAALAAGADAIRMGTRFVATHEANAHAAYLAALAEAKPEDTVLTEAFSVMWPDAPHRVLQTAVVAAQALQDEFVGEAEHAGEKLPVLRLSVISPGRTTTGNVEAMALYAGQSVGAVTEAVPAAQVVAEVAEGADELLRRWAV
jgi:NAD(P)H-dependent flavin oxidoreductase YrpB (nitropropane dioxygenase family)